MRSSRFLGSLVFGAWLLSQTATGLGNTVLGGYIVELDESYDLNLFYDEPAIKALPGLKPRRVLDYKLFKGVSFQVDYAEDRMTEVLSQVETIRKFWPIHNFMPLQTKVTSVPNNVTATALLSSSGIWKRNRAPENSDSTFVMSQVDKLRNAGLTGKGVRIGMVDSGVDYTHPALGGCFGPGCLVAFGRDFAGDEGNNDVKPDDDPRDCTGHGTHVAGIIAAQENALGFTGVAPGVELGVYKVQTCPGNAASTDLFLSGFFQAHEDGVDIITASLGWNSGWQDDAGAMAVSRIVANGTIVFVALGNAGNTGIMSGAAPASGSGVIAVGSIDNTVTPQFVNVGTFQTRNSSDFVKSGEFEWNGGSANQNDWKNITLPLWSATNSSDDTNVACQPLSDDTPDLSGFVVLLPYGECLFQDQLLNLQRFGARNVLWYANSDRPSMVQPLDTLFATSEGLNRGSVTNNQGKLWLQSLSNGDEITVTLHAPSSSPQKLVNFPNNYTGGFPSHFTSWGPNFGLEIKPQFSAPGGSILSTWPVKSGGFAVSSGTSMATPFAAGVAALLIEARGEKILPAEMESLLSTTALPVAWNNGTQTASFLAPVAQQGGGLIQAYAASSATMLVDKSSLSFNDTENLQELNFTLHNHGKKTTTYHLSHIAASTVQGFDIESGRVPPFNETSFFPQDGNLKFSQEQLTIDPGQKETILVSAVAPALDPQTMPIYSGFIAINSSHGESLIIPYQGVAATMRNLQVLNPKYNYFSSSDGSPFQPTYVIPFNSTSNQDTLPCMQIDLSMGSRLLRVDVVPERMSAMNTTQLLGVPTLGPMLGYPMAYIDRRSFSDVFTGQLESREFVPEGSYKLILRGLNIFGDESKVGDWSVIESPPFNIKYKREN